MIRRPSPLMQFLNEFLFELIVAVALGLMIANL
jgi:hypothetical protein